MRRIDSESRKILNELKRASPNQVGQILKKYFKLKKDKMK